MARSVNRATLVGNIGQDPELRSTPGGRTYAVSVWQHPKLTRTATENGKKLPIGILLCAGTI